MPENKETEIRTTKNTKAESQRKQKHYVGKKFNKKIWKNINENANNVSWLPSKIRMSLSPK